MRLVHLVCSLRYRAHHFCSSFIVPPVSFATHHYLSFPRNRSGCFGLPVSAPLYFSTPLCMCCLSYPSTLPMIVSRFRSRYAIICCFCYPLLSSFVALVMLSLLSCRRSYNVIALVMKLTRTMSSLLWFCPALNDTVFNSDAVYCANTVFGTNK